MRSTDGVLPAQARKACGAHCRAASTLNPGGSSHHLSVGTGASA
jgi:hypothetical protein